MFLGIIIIVGYFLGVYLLYRFFMSVNNDKNGKATKRQEDVEDNTSLEIQDLGYDSSGRQIPTKLEKVVAIEDDPIKTLHIKGTTRDEIRSKKARRSGKNIRREINRIRNSKDTK